VALLGFAGFAAPAAHALVPGTNGRIVFESSRDGNSEIYAMNPDGSVQQRLTSDRSNDSDPAWSPDGSQIAFTSTRGGDRDIYVMNADGTNVRPLTANLGEDSGASWTSDGLKIVFHSAQAGGTAQPHPLDVWIMNADGTGQTNLTPGTPTAQDAAAYVIGSSTSGKIVFNSNRDNPGVPGIAGFEIYSMGIGGGGVQRLTNNLVADSGPVWSATGDRIAFNRIAGGGTFDVFVMNADGSGATDLTNNNTFDAFAGFSPDGTRIVATSSVNGDLELFSMSSTNGSGRMQLTNVTGGDVRPDWGSNPAVPVVGPPATKDACKNGAWQVQNNPSFKNQGDCVSYFNAITDPDSHH